MVSEKVVMLYCGERKENEMTSFDFDGKKYKDASTHQKEWGVRVLGELTFRGNEKVLDLGCGDGILTQKISEFVPNGFVLGIDASKGMIETAQELRKDNLFFQLMDINEIDYDSEFDIVFSNAALHWVMNHDNLLKSVYKTIKPNGFIRFNFAGDGNCSNFYRVVKEVMAYPKFEEKFEMFEWPWYMPKIEEYRVLVEKFKFKEIKVWEENSDRYFSSSEEMTKWIDQPSIVPFLKHLDEKDKTEFRDIVVQKMMNATKQEDGTCFETFRRINVYARK
ncbi:class I SAM-dependent methyltransferase [Macellibacteroides fermentans]|uniref:class I SAM-dependent methyltransferase n=1 Tax=Macellibacteroides fermentans TaxID=879969 RepID=UPI00406CC8C6